MKPVVYENPVGPVASRDVGEAFGDGEAEATAKAGLGDAVGSGPRAPK
jgi:hypothetical protein